MAETFKYVRTWPGRIEVAEKEIPKINDDEILVRVELSGICGTDRHVYEEGYGPHRISGSVEYPLILGHEYIGIAEKVGKDVEKKMFIFGGTPEEGDRVYWGLDLYDFNIPFEWYLPGWQQWAFTASYGFSPEATGIMGAWGQYVVLKPGSIVFKMPEDLTPEEGVVIEPYQVGLRSVDRALSMLAIAEKEANPDTDLFLIQGSGTIGLAVLVALKNVAPYSTVIVTDMKEHRLKMAKEFGADYVINVSETTKEERIEMIKDIATSVDRPDYGDRWGVDCAFDCTGTNAHEVIPEGIEVCRPGAVYIEVGAFTYNTAGKFTIDPHEICTRELIFTGNWAYPISTIIKAATQVARGLFKKIPYYKIITHRWSLEEIPKAMELAGKYEGIKHIVDPWK